MAAPAIVPRQVILPICIGTGLSLLGDTTLYAVLPTHTQEAGVLLAGVGILLSANRWIRLPLNGPAGWLLERLPRKPVFLGGLLLGAVTTGMYAIDAGFWNLLIARLLWGLAWIGIWMGGTTIVFDITDETNRGRWIGTYQVAFFIGAGVGSFSGGILTDLLGYHSAMAVNASLTLAGALYVWAALPETGGGLPTQLRSRSAPLDPASQASGTRRASELRAAIALLASVRLAQEGFLLASLALYLERLFGSTVFIGGMTIGSATLTGAGLGLTTLISASSAPVSGVISDRTQNRWGVAVGSLLLGAAGFIALGRGSPAWIFLGLAGTSMAAGSCTNIATSLIGDLGARSQQGRRLGGLFTIGDLGSAAGPPLVFWLEPTIGIPGVYAIAAAIFAVMTLLSWSWSRAR